MRIRELAPLLLAVAVAGCGPGGLSNTADSQSSDATTIIGTVKALPDGDAASAALQLQSQVAPMYAADFVGTAATGYALNDAGDVVGKSYTDPGCGPFCLPPQENVIWRGGARIVLPLLPGVPIDYQYPRYINNQGLIAGVVGYPGSSTHAAAWFPDGAGYAAADLGTLPGMSSADVAGLDDQGRMVGWSTLGGAIPSAAAPFMWSQPTGMVNLAAQGYPNERPAAISQGGSVVM